MTYTIWHKPTCSTSRFVLIALRDAGVDVVVRDYIKEPPSVAELEQALSQLDMTPRALLRRKGTPFDDLGLGNTGLADAALVTAMAEHPILIERPVVFGPQGAVLCRPKEKIFDFLVG
ncbi:arsenate reductase (glutaredoxin) [Paracoccus sp. JM45]|uniref:arsenate reductase (glutaredoxin) n=1 Tax=Paracoccus sp. JM45 TaxID=2283626 RepID=UPI000E6BCAF9|nr:arsenate reductase (glutaredoxin) [Paracoccus sp. JM45]RJE80602.1 arsenate reductase (glutaredoxin) [Paracoccus sp. JM45]